MVLELMGDMYMSEVDTGAIVPDTKDVKESVSKNVYEEVMQDLHSQKTKNRELSDRLKAFETEQENLKIKAMKDQDQWKTLAEVREKEAEDLKKKLDSQNKSTSNYFKRSEIRQQALKHGIRENALDDIDLLSLDDVQIETTSTGKVNILGADKFVDRLRATKPHWFTDKTDPGVATSTPKTTKPSSIDAKDVAKLYKEGKMAEYNEAMAKLRKQK